MPRRDLRGGPRMQRAPKLVVMLPDEVLSLLPLCRIEYGSGIDLGRRLLVFTWRWSRITEVTCGDEYRGPNEADTSPSAGSYIAVTKGGI